MAFRDDTSSPSGGLSDTSPLASLQGMAGFNISDVIFGTAKTAKTYNSLNNLTSATEPMVPMNHAGLSPGMERNYIGPVEQQILRPLTSVIMDMYKWTPEEKKANIARIEKATGMQINNDDQLEAEWTRLVTSSSKYNAAGQTVTPWDVLDLYSQDGALGSKLAGKTITTSRTSFTDPGTAKAMVSQILRQKLGRDATMIEERNFIDSLKADEGAHPTVTSTTYDRMGNATNSTTSGGTSPAGFGEQYGDALRTSGNQEYAEYQGATTYHDAFIKAIKSPV